MSDTEMRMLKEYSRMREMLRKALEEMRPTCGFCIYGRQNSPCVNPCKWKRYEEARELVGGEP